MALRSFGPHTAVGCFAGAIARERWGRLGLRRKAGRGTEDGTCVNGKWPYNDGDMKLFAAVALCSAAMWAQTPAAPTVSKVFAGPVNSIEREMVPLVEAMPEEKLAFAPKDGAFKGVRTFAQQATHTAAVLFAVGSALLGEKNPTDMGENENGPAKLKSKADVVQYVKDAFAYAKKAAATVNEGNQLEMIPSPFGQGKMARAAAVQILAWHSFDHYGQMVVYARMNGVVPPASR